MPDMERLTRRAYIYVASKTNPEIVSDIQAYFAGQDMARKEIAVVAGIVSGMVLFVCFLIGRY